MSLSKFTGKKMYTQLKNTIWFFITIQNFENYQDASQFEDIEVIVIFNGKIWRTRVISPHAF